MKAIYDNLADDTCKRITKRYSTSFSLGISFLAKDLQQPIYNLYAYVRLADEIVDSFHGFNKEYLLLKFEQDTYEAIESGISLNPVLNSFQKVVNSYSIPHELIDCFLASMKMDLKDVEYDQELYNQYILGSAEVVGLMCLCVFLRGDKNEYKRLKPYAMKLGSAFQKINFLRDLNADAIDLGRSYFPGVDLNNFSALEKKKIEQEIQEEFDIAYKGILMLPKDARFGVYLAYIYYTRLLNKIKATTSNQLLSERVRLPNQRKYGLFINSLVRHQFNLL